MGGGRGRRGARRERGGFSSPMKQKVKGKIALSFASPEKEKYFLIIYEVITWGKKKALLISSHTCCPVLCCCRSCSLQFGPSRLFPEVVTDAVRPH